MNNKMNINNYIKYWSVISESNENFEMSNKVYTESQDMKGDAIKKFWDELNKDNNITDKGVARKTSSVEARYRKDDEIGKTIETIIQSSDENLKPMNHKEAKNTIKDDSYIVKNIDSPEIWVGKKKQYEGDDKTRLYDDTGKTGKFGKIFKPNENNTVNYVFVPYEYYKKYGNGSEITMFPVNWGGGNITLKKGSYYLVQKKNDENDIYGIEKSRFEETYNERKQNSKDVNEGCFCDCNSEKSNIDNLIKHWANILIKELNDMYGDNKKLYEENDVSNETVKEEQIDEVSIGDFFGKLFNTKKHQEKMKKIEQEMKDDNFLKEHPMAKAVYNYQKKYKDAFDGINFGNLAYEYDDYRHPPQDVSLDYVLIAPYMKQDGYDYHDWERIPPTEDDVQKFVDYLKYQDGIDGAELKVTKIKGQYDKEFEYVIARRDLSTDEIKKFEEPWKEKGFSRGDGGAAERQDKRNSEK